MQLLTSVSAAALASAAKTTETMPEQSILSGLSSRTLGKKNDWILTARMQAVKHCLHYKLSFSILKICPHIFFKVTGKAAFLQTECSPLDLGKSFGKGMSGKETRILNGHTFCPSRSASTMQRLQWQLSLEESEVCGRVALQ